MSEKFDQQIGDLKFDLSRNAMYNAAREGWFAGWHRFVMFLTVFSGTGAAITILSKGSPVISIMFGLFVALVSTIDLVVDLSGRARLHNGLRQRFFSLRAELETADIDDEMLSSIRSRLYLIYGEEPPIMRVLDAMVWNQAYLSLYGDVKKEDLISLKMHEKLLCQLWAFHSKNFLQASKLEE